jgi:hypothetical protein
MTLELAHVREAVALLGTAPELPPDHLDRINLSTMRHPTSSEKSHRFPEMLMRCNEYVAMPA